MKIGCWSEMLVIYFVGGLVGYFVGCLVGGVAMVFGSKKCKKTVKIGGSEARKINILRRKNVLFLLISVIIYLSLLI